MKRHSLLLIIILLVTTVAAANADTDNRKGKGKRKTVVVNLPAKHKVIHHRGATYHYNGGVFYHRGPKNYTMIRPPLGLVINALPLGHITLRIGSANYYHYDDVYYRKAQQGYVVVEKPVREGVISSDYEATIGARISVDVDHLNFRSNPTRKSSVLRVLKRGTRMKVLEEGRNWYFVELKNGRTGWVMKRYTRTGKTQAQG